MIHPGFRAQPVIKILVIDLGSALTRRSCSLHATVFTSCNSPHNDCLLIRALDKPCVFIRDVLEVILNPHARHYYISCSSAVVKDNKL